MTEIPRLASAAKSRAATPGTPSMPGPRRLTSATPRVNEMPQATRSGPLALSDPRASTLDQRARVFGPEGVADAHRNTRRARRRDRPRMQDLGAEMRQLHRLFVAHALEAGGRRGEARIGGEDAVDIGPDLEQARLESLREERRRVVRAAAAEAHHLAALVATEEAGQEQYRPSCAAPHGEPTLHLCPAAASPPAGHRCKAGAPRGRAGRYRGHGTRKARTGGRSSRARPGRWRAPPLSPSSRRGAPRRGGSPPVRGRSQPGPLPASHCASRRGPVRAPRRSPRGRREIGRRPRRPGRPRPPRRASARRPGGRSRRRPPRRRRPPAPPPPLRRPDRPRRACARLPQPRCRRTS